MARREAPPPQGAREGHEGELPVPPPPSPPGNQQASEGSSLSRSRSSSPPAWTCSDSLLLRLLLLRVLSLSGGARAAPRQGTRAGAAAG